LGGIIVQFALVDKAISEMAINQLLQSGLLLQIIFSKIHLIPNETISPELICLLLVLQQGVNN